MLVAPQLSCALHSGAQQPTFRSQLPGARFCPARPYRVPCRLHKGQAPFVSRPAPSRRAQCLARRAAPAACKASMAQAVFELSDIDAKTAGTLAAVLRPVLSVGILLMIVRIVLSWYPQLDGGKLPWSLAFKPTEPVLGPTRRAIPPVGGVDVSPIVWVALLSFFNEILLGPQGILNLLQRKIDLP